MCQKDTWFIYCGNETGQNFLRTLACCNQRYIVFVLSAMQQQDLQILGVNTMMLCNNQLPIDKDMIAVSKVFIFEDDVAECSTAIQCVCKTIPRRNICVITHDTRPMLKQLYKELGAGIVLNTKSSDVSFLVTKK